MLLITCQRIIIILGLKEKHILSHIAYDIGAQDFCIKLANILNQSCFLSNFSRLIIDPNRPEKF